MKPVPKRSNQLNSTTKGAKDFVIVERTEPESIRTLFDLYANDIYRFACMTLRNESDAKDVVQEVFLRAHQYWYQYRGEAGAKTWLMTIARHYMWDLQKKRKRERRWIGSVEHKMTVLSVTEDVETLMLIEEVLFQLKESYRQVVVLRHLEDLSVEHTASILGWSVSKVTTTDSRALRKMRALLEGKGVDVDVELQTEGKSR